MNDSELIKNILKRDRRALYNFYQTYTPKLIKYIQSRVNNPHDGEEILQDTLFSFLESARDYAGKSSIKTFIFSICSHKVIDYYRRRKIKQVVFSQMPQLENLVSPLLSPEDTLDSIVLREKISQVLGKLLPKYKQILLSKYTENESVAEIAQKLEITGKSVESILFRARKAFVKAFIAI
jgi:RNA polymerase sigma-70 factor, ECF subfamily